MKINPLLMDVARGEWLMSFSGISAYASIAHKLITGESVDLMNQPKAISTIIDDNGRIVQPGANGLVEPPLGSVAIVDMIGPIMKYGDWCTYGADEIVRSLYEADRHPNIIGTLLNQDGPGGAVSAIGPFLDFGKNKTKPVVTLADQSASLHYWAMCAVSDHKMADNNVSAVFGSVGIVANYRDTQKYLETLGYVFHEIYPEESEDKNKAFRMAMQGDYELIKKEHLSPIALKFQDGVRSTCPNLREEPGVLTGKTFGADLALEYGMIDSIGSRDKAINMLHVMRETNLYK